MKIKGATKSGVMNEGNKNIGTADMKYVGTSNPMNRRSVKPSDLIGSFFINLKTGRRKI
ncbi:MAG: hypothetical protein H7644_15055 [Candidatus Heimdallarchaeota archaeon]|nr:hypothetical protein [Candidatus Heimdallarchaeota archaeon]